MDKDNNPSWGSGWGEGDIMFKDLNGDKVINEGANTVDDPGDRKLLVTPPHVSGLV